MRFEDLGSQPDLAPLVEYLRLAAANSGITVIDALPSVSDLPKVVFEGPWQRFLELGALAGSTFLYVEQDQYSPEFLTSLFVSRQGERKLRSFTSADDSTDDPEQWLRDHLRETITEWDRYTGAVGSVRCLWVHQDILHIWTGETDWYADAWSAADKAIEDLDLISETDRTERRQNDAKLLHDLATQLAHHPRFSDAKSDAKRQFVAEQLFSDELHNESHRFRARDIASRAEMIYWWEVEPVEKVTRDERIREMRARGDSIRNIAVALKVSEAKVKAALGEA